MPTKTPADYWSQIQLAYFLIQTHKGVPVSNLKALSNKEVDRLWLEANPDQLRAQSEFSRQEALYISELTSGTLSRLDKSGTIVPTKIGNPAHPSVTYSFRQILKLGVVAALQDRLSATEIKRVIESINSRKLEIDHSLLQKYIIFQGQWLHWVSEDGLGSFTVQLIGDTSVKFKIVAPIRQLGGIVHRFLR